MHDAIAQAYRLKDDGVLSFGRWPGHIRYLVRVPGKMVGECKLNGVDCEPCILMEVEIDGVVRTRYLAFEAQFHGPTVLTQNVETPCASNGAILWLATEHAVTLRGRHMREGV